MLSSRQLSHKQKKPKKWYIELRDHLQTVRRFPAFEDKRQSEALGRQIERLVRYKVSGEQPDPQLSQWLEQIPDRRRKQACEPTNGARSPCPVVTWTNAL